MDYYTRKKQVGEPDCFYTYVKADIGWRWCKDEMPEKFGYYPVIWDGDSHGMASWYNGTWNPVTYSLGKESISQWFKMPPPMVAVKQEVTLESLAARIDRLEGRDGG